MLLQFSAPGCPALALAMPPSPCSLGPPFRTQPYSMMQWGWTISPQVDGSPQDHSAGTILHLKSKGCSLFRAWGFQTFSAGGSRRCPTALTGGCVCPPCPQAMQRGYSSILLGDGQPGAVWGVGSLKEEAGGQDRVKTAPLLPKP